MVRQAVVEPFADFLRRNGAATPPLILLFIMLYKLGDALLGAMANPFYVELGFTKTEVATVVKTYGLVATLAGGLLGGMIINAPRHPAGALDLRPLPDALQPHLRAQAWVGHERPLPGAHDLAREPRRRHGDGGFRRLSELALQPRATRPPSMRS